jgi:MerR family mercuric resistance operon transcriptional regulator
MNTNRLSQDHLIGEASRQTGVHIETIRYYERIGIMPEPRRSAGKHRLYDEAQLKRLNFIKRSRELGFSLNEIRSLLSLNDDDKLTCSEVHSLTIDHLKHVRGKIARLRGIQATLENMAEQCSRGNVPECPIIETLNGH